MKFNQIKKGIALTFLATTLIFTSVGCNNSSANKEIDKSVSREVKMNNLNSLRMAIQTTAMARLAEYMNVKVEGYPGDQYPEFDNNYNRKTELIGDSNLMVKFLDKSSQSTAGFELYVLNQVREALQINVTLSDGDKEKYFDEAKFYVSNVDFEKLKPEEIPDTIYLEVKISDIMSEMLNAATNSVIIELAKDNKIEIPGDIEQLMTIDKYKEANQSYFKAVNLNQEPIKNNEGKEDELGSTEEEKPAE